MSLLDNCIRLVSIFAAADEDDLQLSAECVRTLSTESARPNPETDEVSYIALSYAWGSESVGLVCDGTVYQVSSNLPPALRSLHKHFHGRLIWTDSLSINQQDTGEKRYQVSIMGKIFSRAEVVAVWLGEGTGGIYQDLCRLVSTSPDDLYASKERIKVLTNLANCAWFYRAWTFQEIRLADHAVALFDDHYVSWNQFVEVIMKVRELEPGLSTTSVRSTPRSESRFRPRTQDRFFAMIEELNTGTSNDLADLLFLTWYRDASEKRDKVYALLSAELLTKPDHGIQVNYDISWNYLCIQSVRAALNTARNLKVLKFAGMVRRWKSAWTNRWDPQELLHLLQHPSWAPDWWNPPQNTRSPASFRYSKRGVFDTLNFCCSLTPPVQLMNNTDPLLFLSGIFLGVINTDQEPTYAGGPTLVHPPPPCTNMTRELLVSPNNADVVIPRVTTHAFVTALEKHLQGQCLCFPPLFQNSRLISAVAHGVAKPPKLKFSNNKFTINFCSTSPELKEHEQPAQVLAESIESGDWLVLLEGSSDPLVVRPVKDRNGRIPRPHEFSSYDKYDMMNGDEGIFMLVGEASMCWDELWPKQWSSYCRACAFVLI